MMMLIPRRRLGRAILTCLLAALCGVVLGYQSAREHVRRTTEAKLVLAAQQGVSPFLALLHEATSLLTQIHTSPWPACSPEEIAFLRKQIFHSINLHDAGRMRNDRLRCSALHERQQLSQEELHPSVTRIDGLQIYRNVPPFNSTTQQVYLIRMNDAFVVEDPGQYNHWHLPDVQYESSYQDPIEHRRRRPGGDPLLYPNAVLDRDYRGFLGDIQYVTICTPGEYLCTSAFEPFPDALRADRLLIVTRSLLGALSGLVVALLGLLLLMRNRGMTQQLRRAIRLRQIQTVYQPVLEIASGRMVAAEVLARWSDEDGFAISPEIFVLFAEEQGFIEDLTECILTNALKDFAEWMRGEPEFCLYLNVTAHDLEGTRLLPMLNRLLSEHQLPASAVALEITEGSTARRTTAIESIRQLRQRGHRVLIDDFGTGYSSLAYLKDLNVDAIKIDKAFTQALGTDAVTAHILPRILDLAATLGLQVLIEGIETPEQAAWFAGHPMNLLGQGWFYGHPGDCTGVIQNYRKTRQDLQPS